VENHPGQGSASNSNLNSKELIPTKRVFRHIKRGLFHRREIMAPNAMPN
jgi:hypothetical protein